MVGVCGLHLSSIWMLAAFAAAGNWERSRGPRVWCWAGMKSRGFVVQKTAPEAVQVIQKGQRFSSVSKQTVP